MWWFNNLGQKGSIDCGMIMQSQFVFFPSYLKLGKCCWKIGWWYKNSDQEGCNKTLYTTKSKPQNLWRISGNHSWHLLEGIWQFPIKTGPMDIFLAGFLLLMYSMVTLMSGIVFHHCLTFVSLVLLPAELPKKVRIIGSVETSCSDVKQLKGGKWSNLGGIS